MAKFSVSKFKDMQVVTDMGNFIGYVRDLIIDEVKGDIIAFVCVPEKKKTSDLVKRLPTDREGNLLVPRSTVKSISTIIVVDEKALRIAGLRFRGV